jgi:hypothetical protein
MIVSALIVNNTRQSPAQPHSGDTFERFHIASTGFGESRQFDVDLCARSRGKLAPLTDGCGSKSDFLHILYIA